MKVENIAEWSRWWILQYFRPAFSDNRYWKQMLGLLFECPLKTGFTVTTDKQAHEMFATCRVWTIASYGKSYLVSLESKM